MPYYFSFSKKTVFEENTKDEHEYSQCQQSSSTSSLLCRHYKQGKSSHCENERNWHKIRSGFTLPRQSKNSPPGINLLITKNAVNCIQIIRL